MSLKSDFHAILSAAIDAIDPYNAVSRHLAVKDSFLSPAARPGAFPVMDLDSFRRIIVVGAGKATAPMARAVEELLGNRISAGLIAVKDGHRDRLEIVEQVEASHPVPDARGCAAAARILDLVKDCGESDLVISLFSGGGSALIPAPAEGITLREKQAVTDLLLRSGATISEINAVRKHISLVKGGMLAAAAHPATVLNLMVSDVVGDDTGVIASGPFRPDASTFSAAMGVLEKYGITSNVPYAVLNRLEIGKAGTLKETPKPGDELFSRVYSLIVASNIEALVAARDAAVKLGYSTLILSSMIEGDTADAARWHARIAREIAASGHPAPRPACVLSGGETTVMVRGGGKGGRNMEFALHAAVELDGIDNILIGSAGTDGTDGPTDAAGAVADGTTMARARRAGLDAADFIAQNDSYHFFEKLGDLVMTGPTRTNVMDVRIILAGK